MSDESEPIKKRYFTINEVSILLGEPQPNIRFWLKTFNLEVLRTSGKRMNRRFTENDIETLKTIKYLLKIRQFTIKGALKEFAGLSYNKEEITNSLRVG